MTSGDIGATIAIDTGGYNIIGATCTLIAAPGKLPAIGQGTRLSPITASASGLIGYYRSTGREFTQGGLWQMQLEVLGADGSKYLSPPRKIYIFPRL
jgi:hypothetical protein